MKSIVILSKEYWVENEVILFLLSVFSFQPVSLSHFLYLNGAKFNELLCVDGSMTLKYNV